MDQLNPIRIGIGLNILLTIANFAIPAHTSFGRWYFDRNGMFWIMGGIWAVLLPWAIIIG